MNNNSYMSRIKKRILIGLTIFIGISAFLYYQLHHGKDEVYLLPNGFTGIVYIYSSEQGAKKEFEGTWLDKVRVYRIPNNGVLLTQFEPSERFRKVSYFYVDSQGNRTELQSPYTQNRKGFILKPKTHVASIYRESVLDENDNPLIYDSFLVGTDKQITIFHEERKKVNILQLIDENLKK